MLNCRLRRNGSVCRIALACALFLVSGLGHEAEGGNEKSQRRFNHATTGFSLTGGHARALCITCHVRGVFRGTPRQCMSCHTRGRRFGTTPKPANHIPTFRDCSNCHRTTAWVPARFNHGAVTPGSCSRCHNGVTAPGKSNNHIQTAASCDSCHRTRAWLPATFSHVGVAPGTCERCHNGVSATGKPGNHVPTAATCDSCHRTAAWIPATVSR